MHVLMDNGRLIQNAGTGFMVISDSAWDWTGIDKFCKYGEIQRLLYKTRLVCRGAGPVLQAYPTSAYLGHHTGEDHAKWYVSISIGN